MIASRGMVEKKLQLLDDVDELATCPFWVFDREQRLRASEIAHEILPLSPPLTEDLAWSDQGEEATQEGIGDHGADEAAPLVAESKAAA